MSRRLLSRVARLEREAKAGGGVPFQFWRVLTGEVTLDEVEPGTRAFLDHLLPDGEVPDEIEELLRFDVSPSQ